jgi:[ribosomal protein S5]-alanine N-acetyltransferase
MILTTERLILREFVESDWETVLDYQQEPLYLRYNEWDSRTPDQVREFIQMFLDYQKQEPRIKFQLAITLKSSEQLIGNCGIRKGSVEAQEADLGYELDPGYWGKGYATEAARIMLDFGFSHLALQRITAWCIADNAGSARVLEKIGMHLKSRTRKHQYFKGRWWDTLSYSISREEWQAKE